jgi:sugar phosphate isomerase/epimerase
MYNFPIGVMIDSFKLPMKEAIEKTVAIGAKGFQMYATYGEHSPESMTAEKIAELKDMVYSNGLVFSALCGDLGHGFGNAEKNPALIEKSKRIIDLAKELGTDVVTTHIGVVPTDKNHDRYKIMQEACYELSRYADSINAHFAIETGPETSAVLGDFLDSLESTGVGVNLDPANLVMVTGDDPVKAVHRLKKYIVHTHAKDGVKLYDMAPELIYGVTPMPEDMKNITCFREEPLGKGGVDFPAYLRALEEIGYRGFLTIEREAGNDPAKDIGEAADFLRGVMAAG